MSEIVKCSVNENLTIFIVSEIVKKGGKNRSKSGERISVRQLCLEIEIIKMAYSRKHNYLIIYIFALFAYLQSC